MVFRVGSNFKLSLVRDNEDEVNNIYLNVQSKLVKEGYSNLPKEMVERFLENGGSLRKAITEGYILAKLPLKRGAISSALEAVASAFSISKAKVNLFHLESCGLVGPVYEYFSGCTYLMKAFAGAVVDPKNIANEKRLPRITFLNLGKVLPWSEDPGNMPKWALMEPFYSEGLRLGFNLPSKPLPTDYKYRAYRSALIRYVIGKEGADPLEVSRTDLERLLRKHASFDLPYSIAALGERPFSIEDLLVDALFLAPRICALKDSLEMSFDSELPYIWERKTRLSKKYSRDKELAIAQIRWVAFKIGSVDIKLWEEIYRNRRRFRDSLGYRGDSVGLLQEAKLIWSREEIIEHSNTFSFSDEKPYPWELRNAQVKGFWDKEMAVAATRWLAWKLGKKELTIEDFKENGIWSLVSNHYSFYGLLVDSGLVYSEDELREMADEGRLDRTKAYPWEVGTSFPRSIKVDACLVKLYMIYVAEKEGKNPGELSFEAIRRAGGYFAYSYLKKHKLKPKDLFPS